jgi:hypothetical protein
MNSGLSEGKTGLQGGNAALIVCVLLGRLKVLANFCEACAGGHPEGIVPKGRVNKMTDLQETKFLRLFGLTHMHYYTTVCNCLYLCVRLHQHYSLLA